MAKKIHHYPIPTVCDYCGGKVVLTSNATIYGREYGSGQCYRCTQCDAYVGVHAGTDIPLGRLANKHLRRLKKVCHNLFDPIWQGNPRITREQAYGRLANVLDIPVSECHFGWFDKAMLERCIGILSKENWYLGVNWRQPKTTVR